jgi:hypothetical protein
MVLQSWVRSSLFSSTCFVTLQNLNMTHVHTCVIATKKATLRPHWSWVKPRVTPHKSVKGEEVRGSIPRLELTSAVVAAEVGRFLTVELEVNLTERIFWTDAT